MCLSAHGQGGAGRGGASGAKGKRKFLQQIVPSYSPICENSCYWHSKMSRQNINREMRSHVRKSSINLSKNQNFPSRKGKKKKKKATSKIKDRNVTWKVKEGGEHFFLEYSLFATITSETRRTLCSGGSHFKFLLQSDHFRAKQINRLKEVLKHAKPGRQGQVWCILRPQNGTFRVRGWQLSPTWPIGVQILMLLTQILTAQHMPPPH